MCSCAVETPTRSQRVKFMSPQAVVATETRMYWRQTYWHVWGVTQIFLRFQTLLPRKVRSDVVMNPADTNYRKKKKDFIFWFSFRLVFLQKENRSRSQCSVSCKCCSSWICFLDRQLGVQWAGLTPPPSFPPHPPNCSPLSFKRASWTKSHFNWKERISLFWSPWRRSDARPSPVSCV